MPTVCARVWGVLWRAKTDAHGPVATIMGGVSQHGLPFVPLMFRTRREAARHIADNYGYIRHRRDLRGPPHSWRMPVPVRLLLTTSTMEGRRGA